MAVEFHEFLCLTDNFGLLAHDQASGATACLDAPEAEPIFAALAEKGWVLTHIWLTHHHDDHIGAVAELKARFPKARVVGARKDAHRLPPLDVAVSEGEFARLGDNAAVVIETPGHTLGHIAYYFEDDDAVVVGDTLFSLGCGRVMEGTMPMMHETLMRLADLPGETQVFCGHEYTEANARFAVTVDPGNALLAERVREVADLRARGAFTLPSTIARECETNPFLRAANPQVQKALGLELADPVEAFTIMRERKNRF
ncbi:hydroxyacylglutathione hydrolase [Rhodoblastus acidophilus]|uniref:Hydroxyacylglutathione hydrolase n=1 Tax=Candidatus Rhodoblastus alkanivorans TaxID=2954117 RepID=A0ABS9Z0L1_9HYPH|nr:hydroxyacylglutathione hydrolase [Candidatus Rhodoblastus alkanivorans]MCI4678140.1 hydroxyacylglutathione hydrolase [Candidatus Rhodoblastus alkanivorans]MCI4681190.1 hydroxyacylglutathione hydrolase [Candidatus Rhodoblastus alkanivorans]MDI4642233.1 hydroxyacylglutathione hydrolase [Rhodoblastus acidophilus]